MVCKMTLQSVFLFLAVLEPVASFIVIPPHLHKALNKAQESIKSQLKSSFAAPQDSQNYNGISPFLNTSFFGKSKRQPKQQQAREQVLERKSSRFQNVKRLDKLPIEELDEMLDRDLYYSQWLVNGNVDPKYFCNDFVYNDADGRLNSLEDYVDDVRARFDQKVTRADVISTQVNPERGPNTITCTWRLSGRASLGGFNINPCIVHTDFVINPENGLIQRQEDRFSIRHWDIFLPALFPPLEGRWTAPEVLPWRIETPNNQKVLPVEAWTGRSGISSYFAATAPNSPRPRQAGVSAVTVATQPAVQSVPNPDVMATRPPTSSPPTTVMNDLRVAVAKPLEVYQQKSVEEDVDDAATLSALYADIDTRAMSVDEEEDGGVINNDDDDDDGNDDFDPVPYRNHKTSSLLYETLSNNIRWGNEILNFMGQQNNNMTMAAVAW